MSIELNNNVYIVKGKKFDCIYNLNNRRLYRINKSMSEFIDEIILLDESDYITLSKNQRRIIKALSENEILVTGKSKANAIDYRPEIDIDMAWIEITQKCNFRCIHCYEGDKLQKAMAFDNVIYCIDRLIEHGVKKLQIIGGEPLLHSSIEQILEYCKGKFDEFSIFTNASFVTERICKLLKELNSSVYISLHSDIETEFDAFTGTKGMLPKVLQNVDYMREYGLNAVLKRVKVKSVSVSTEYEAMQFGLNGFPVLVGHAKLEQYDDEMLKKKLITEKSFSELLDVESVINNMNLQYCFSKKVYIDVNLDVFPCILERRRKHGNLLKSNLSDIINIEICRFTKDNIEDCKDCEYRYACNTCFPDTASENFSAKPWFCTYNPREGIWENTI